MFGDEDSSLKKIWDSWTYTDWNNETWQYEIHRNFGGVGWFEKSSKRGGSQSLGING